ncbi:D-alanyl-D-alanine carboxypeptidase family protein [bacterium D16-76]|nr:D-alanyl-D-alanine carboxypeptidase family protein [bacterium D16-76]
MKAKRPAKRRRSLCFFYIAGLLIPVALLLALASALLRDASGESPAPSTLSDNPASPAPSLGIAGGWEEDSPWQLRLVNSAHPLPEDWAPDLTVLDPYTGEEFDSRAVGYLNEMLSAMESEGLQPLVCSGYRSYESQVRIFQDNVEDAIAQGFSQEEAEQQASLWVMPPGCSEHQSGLAADIVSQENQRLDDTQEDTPEQQWLHAHCQDYGFILRYPPDKTDITGVNYEPWHYRYVGADAARAIMAQGICLEEYSPA